MRIGTELPATQPAQATNAVVQRIAQSKVQQTSSSTPAQETSTTAEVQQARAIQELDLTFRKDSDGITYYVLTDPQSGEVVREVPAKEVGQLSANIEQYLKSQAALAAHWTDSKA